MSFPLAPCQYHPGAPYFHDAYKGWTCCNRKATDFTVFLNFPGCESGKHSNVRPVEPEKITGNLDKDIELPKESSPARTRAPMEALAAKRPDSDSAPFTRLVPKISPGLKRDAESMVEKAGVMKEENGTVTIGESCKNGGCKQVRRMWSLYFLKLKIQSHNVTYFCSVTTATTLLMRASVSFTPAYQSSTRA